MDDYKKYTKIQSEWYQLIEQKNAYLFNELEVDFVFYKKLIRYTYIWLDEVCNKIFIEENKYKKMSWVTELIDVVSLIKAYSIIDVSCEETNEFKATVIIARLLWNEASFTIPYGRERGGNIATDITGILSTCILDGEVGYYDDLSDEELVKVYSYDINEGDFSEMLELAEVACI